MKVVDSDVNKSIFGFDMIPINLPFECEDEDDLKTLFKNHKIIPYAGNYDSMGDRLLSFYDDMAEYSPTSSACIESKKMTIFGTDIEILGKYDDKFSVYKKTIIDSQLAKDYANFITNINYGIDSSFSKLNENCYYEWESNGNIWIEAISFQVAGEWKHYLIRHRTRNTRITIDSKGNKYALVVKSWTKREHIDNGRLIPIYPMVSEKNGVKRTMFHEKAGRHRWYGRPPSKGSYLNQYREFQDLYYLTRLTAKDFTGKILMEIEDSPTGNNRVIDNKRDKDAGFKNTLDRFEKNFSQKSDDPSTLLLFTRPPNSKPMAVEQILPNSNEKYYETMDVINSTMIVRSHAWSQRILGGNSNAYFSPNVYMDELKTKEATVIPSLRNVVQGIVQRALDFCIKNEDLSNYASLMYNYKSPYLTLLENEKIINNLTGDSEQNNNEQDNK